MKKYISLSIIIAFIHIVYCESTSSKISEEYLYRGYTHQKLNHPDSARYFYQRIIDADENMYTTADAFSAAPSFSIFLSPVNLPTLIRDRRSLRKL